MPRRPSSFLKPAALALLVVAVAVACGSEQTEIADQSPALPSAEAAPSETMDPAASIDPQALLCSHIDLMAERLAGLRAVELRLPNRVALDIELGKVQAAYAELRQADLGDLEDRLDDPLRRVGYRIDELQLAVEDFRTNPRPKRAEPHVEGDAAVVADSIASFAILARC